MCVVPPLLPAGNSGPLDCDGNGITGPDWGLLEVVFGQREPGLLQLMSPSLEIPDVDVLVSSSN